MDEEQLPVAVQLAHHAVADQFVVEARDAGFDRQAIFRRRFQVRNVAQAQQRHVQRARNRRGGHGEHVDRGAQGFEPLFHFDAEALLLVDDQQAQVVKVDVGLRQPMRADDDIDRAVDQTGDRFALLLIGGEAAEHFDPEGELGHALGERAAMLFGQNRGGHQHSDLMAGIDRFEGGADGQLGFAVADVAAQQAIHRARLAHVVLDGGDGGQLIGRFLIRERGVEFALPFGVGRKLDAGAQAAHRLHLEHFGGHVDDAIARRLPSGDPTTGRRCAPA